MFFGIISVAVGVLLLLKAIGIISGITWDIILAIVLIAIGVTAILKRR